MSSINMPHIQMPGSNQYGQNTNSQPVFNPYENANNRDISAAFKVNVDIFTDEETGKPTQARLRAIANRPLTGKVADDNMTVLATEILRRPELNKTLVPQYEWEAPKTDEKKKDLPVGAQGDGLARQRVENADKGTGQPNPYAGNSGAQLADYALARFSSLADADGFITDKSLAIVASGKHSDGTPASQAEINLANAILDKGGLFTQFDKGDGKLDGKISRDSLDQFINPYANTSDQDLLDRLASVFDELMAAFGDNQGKFVGYDTLEEAAGLRPTTQVFSREAQAVARELFSERRSTLVRNLDNGGNGGRPDRIFHQADIKSLKGSLPAPPLLQNK